MCLSLSNTHTHTHRCILLCAICSFEVLSLFCSLALSLCRSLVLTPSCPGSPVLSLPRSLTFSLSCSFAILLSLSPSFAPSVSRSLAFSLSNSFALSLSLPHSLALSLSRFLPLSFLCSVALALFRSFALSLFRSFVLSLSYSPALSLFRSAALPFSHSLALSAVFCFCTLALSCFRSLVLSLALSHFRFVNLLFSRPRSPVLSLPRPVLSLPRSHVTKTCSAERSLLFRLVLRPLGPADGGSAGWRNWWHVLFNVLNARVDADSGTALLRTNSPYVFPNWYSSPLQFARPPLNIGISSVDRVC